MTSKIATQGAPTTLEELKILLQDDNKVKVAVDGVLRGKFMSKDKFLSAASSSGFGFCSVIFGWDIHDTVYSRELLISNKQNGYRDILASIDLATYRRLPWEDNVPFFLVSFLDPDTLEPLCADPRGVIKKASDVASKKYQLTCSAGVEYEYYNFKETAESASEKKFSNLQPLTPGMHGYSLLRTQLNNDYFHGLFNESLKLGIEIEGHHTETGPGVLETALAYTDAVRMADNAILYKYVAKSMGMKFGILPSFMAKPWGNLPGCSGHIHVSLKDLDGINIFSVPELRGGRAGAANDDTRYLSEKGEQFLAGVLEGLPDVMPMLVPTINGYKRLSGGEAFWAPNAVTYGYDSRAASVRIISPPSVPPAATRFEIRVPGADMNPYFALGVTFLLGLRGMEKQLKLSIPPISAYQSNPALRDQVTMLPPSLKAATERMMHPNSVAREVLGNEFVEHFGGTRQHEVKLWNQAVTSWEVERYLELV
ncbi:glutamine synthetase guanido kinase [Coniophora puteana RWD-64-598 SS2]|uniref:Glutamine synthetase guanido kinase n=1 Tax=Coniophora puteana (strain RWD-64-598) TaxID=741705 RepID=A0A5M3N1Q6_CONPW|nr:glutamine synthetase guanido kinase [Coniophora puteana RWD-64-598 SS2]EIW84954.1 glutamine synthetase guanido kinase [Coniophora puteana RWD-64-598 SS2]